MRIAIVATNAWPIPTPVHTGDVVILDLAIALDKLGHDVTLFAPSGTRFHKVRETPCHQGTGHPTPAECEKVTWTHYKHELLSFDVVHDFSTEKTVAQEMLNLGRENVISTMLGGNWSKPSPAGNVCVWSHAMRQRALRGETDYWGTGSPDLAGPPFNPIRDAHVVYGGVDTGFYALPDWSTTPKEDFVLWMNRWHPAKGYREAIQMAKGYGTRLVMAGLRPEDNRQPYERACAEEALEMADGKVEFVWLPKDDGHHEAKRELYQRARCLLYPVQFQEPFGLSMVEAMACGTYVVGFGLGSVPEVVGTRGGIVVTPGNLEALARACEAPFDDSGVREYAVKNFSREAMARRYLEQYALVTNGVTWGTVVQTPWMKNP